ncbi:MAG: hypothetical protein R8G01_00395 [Ilumatobacteraceae bacterium]|nr:hypothetical protein [Ilumatobacteraceae bacterium]
MVEQKRIEILEEGRIGVFYRWADTALVKDADPERGWIIRSGPWVHIDTIDESEVPRSLGLLGDDDEVAPTALLGRVNGGTVVAFELQDRGGTAVIVGEQLSTRQYRARTVAVNAPLSRIRSSGVLQMRVDFASLEVFSRLAVAREEWGYAEDRTVKSYQLTLDNEQADQSASMRRGRRIALGSKWSVGGPMTDRRVSVPTSIIIESQKPCVVFELLRPLLEIQNLLSTLHSGFVNAVGAALTLDLEPDDREANGNQPVACWSGPLFQHPPHVASPSNSWPTMTLNDLGGVAGLARWVNLAEDHPRAVGPAVAPFRYGPMVAESDLLTLGASFEYWVAAHRKSGAQWARATMRKGTRSHRKVMESATLQAGKPFAIWVADRAAWCDDFTNAYEELKHDPSFSIDEDLLHDLVQSARHLLFGLLADRVARSRTPTRKLFGPNSLFQLSSRFRQRYAA